MSRTIFITGATGLIGRRLVSRLLERGDRLRVVSRRSHGTGLPATARLEVVVGDVSIPGAWQSAVDGCDAVVHLAGAGIADRRWNPRVLAEIIDSRLDGTHQVVEAIRLAGRKPAVLVGGSAIGWYGATSGPVDETSPQGPPDQLTELCAQWEAQAMEAQSLGVRTVCLRTGLVLDARGGFLAKMLPPFRFFVGGPLGSGRQMMSWIHSADLVGMIEHAIRTPSLRGPLNGTAPQAVSNRAFSRTLGSVMGRPSFFPVPQFALRLVVGPFARYVTLSQHVVPAAAANTGYRFQFPELEPALRDVLEDVEREHGMTELSGSRSDARSAATDDPEGVHGSGGGSVHGFGGALTGASAVGPGGERASEAAAPGAMPARPIRLVVIGIEGALLRADGRLAEGEVLACRAAMDAGCTIALAGARPPRSMMPIAEAMRLSAPLIAYNGALIWDRSVDGGARVVHHEPLDAETAREVIDLARRAAPGVRVGIERLDRWFTDREDDRVNGALKADGVGPLESFLGEPVSQIGLLGTAHEITLVRAALEPTLWKDRRISRFLCGSTLMLAAHRGVDRGIALQRLARRLHIAREEIMVIGGSADDMGMLEWAGFPVAVDTAPPRVLALARAQVPGPADHGVARALHRFVIAPGRIEPVVQGDRR